MPSARKLKDDPGYMLGVYWDNGKENGNYRDYGGYIGILGYILGLYWDILTLLSHYIGVL